MRRTRAHEFGGHIQYFNENTETRVAWFPSDGRWPSAWYITDIAPDMMGIYVNEAGTEFTLPRKGWKRFEGSHSMPGELPAPEIDEVV